MKKDEDIKYQLKELTDIYKHKWFTPGFRMLKRLEKRYPNATAYISYTDIENRQYRIRVRPIGEYSAYDKEERKIIAEYDTILALVKAGWILD